MNILIINNIFPPGYIGGYELGALDIAKGLQANGHEIKVLTSDYFLDDKSQLSLLNISRSLLCTSISHEKTNADYLHNYYYNFHNIRILGDTVRRFKPDLVLAFNLSGLGACSIIQYIQKLKLPLIIYFMDNIFFGLDVSSYIHKRYQQLFGALKIDNYTRVIAMSKNVSNEVSDTLRLKLDEVIYVPAWVDYNMCQSSQSFVERAGSTKFVFCSRIAEHKGVDIVIDAAEQLVRRGYVNFSIDLYGAGHVTPYLQKIMSKNLSQFICYKGSVSKDNILSTLSGYDSLLFPTWEREAFGFVVSEAAVAGCFPVMTAGTGASEWFLDGYDCIKISRDSVALSDAMLQIISWSNDELLMKRKITRVSSMKNFSFDRWLNVIDKVCCGMFKTKPEIDLYKATKRAESAFLFLGTLLREGL